MLKKHEKMILESYLLFPCCKLLKHQFELEQDYLAGYVTRFIHGERFNKEFVPFESYELEVIESLIEKNSQNEDGRDLTVMFYLTKAVCTIMNKYKK